MQMTRQPFDLNHAPIDKKSGLPAPISTITPAF
jgi:hypothetical protein